jgi:putative transposase
MAWRETCVLQERMSFVLAHCDGCEPMTVLCERYGISRKTGYKWLERYAAAGLDGLKDASRAPHRPGHGLAEATIEALVAVRRARPFWGPKKLRAFLRHRQPEVVWPAASTIGDVLRREGLSEPRRRRRRAVPTEQPFAAVTGPNDTWGIDFKGWFRTGDGRRCDPLTVSDAASRYLLACRIVEPTGAGVAAVMERVLREHGLPRSLRMDNGPPFASTGAGGLTRLAVHWAKLGIVLERISPGQPQQNGRHERMHKTLKQETLRPPAGDPAAQQARFDRFRAEFNQVRPHEALGQAPPASRYRASPRPYPAAIADPEYRAEEAVRRVRSNGEIKWGGDLIFLSECLVGEPVGISETASGDWQVRFAAVPLGTIDRATRTLRRAGPGRPARSRPEQTETSVTHVAGP